LVFITVPGEIKIEGVLSDFYTQNKKIFFSYAKNIAFDLVFENSGKIHLNPYGTISVKNIFGQEVKKLELESWFAMPSALRFREVNFVTDSKKDDLFMLGRYTAEAKIFRGYDDKYDTKLLSFWVLPWKLLLVIFVALLIIVWFIRFIIRYIGTHFERKTKVIEIEQKTPEVKNSTTDNPIDNNIK
jgi:hypothetical protein